MKICVFCSANQQIDPEFFTMTEELGTWAAKNGHSIVYGGVNQGLMECLGKAAKEHGAMTIGVVPMIVEKSGFCRCGDPLRQPDGPQTTDDGSGRCVYRPTRWYRNHR